MKRTRRTRQQTSAWNSSTPKHSSPSRPQTTRGSGSLPTPNLPDYGSHRKTMSDSPRKSASCTSTEADTTETTTMATGVSADATAMRMMRDGHTDIARIATDTGHTLVRGRPTDVPTTATVTKGGTDPVETETAAHRDHGRRAGIATTMSAENTASRTRAPNAQAHRDQSLGHHTAPGTTKPAGTRDGLRLPMSEDTTDQSLTAHHQRRRNATKQQSRPNVRSVWQPCNQMHQNWKAIVGLVLRILRLEMRNSARRMIAKDPTRPASSAGFERKLRASILEGDCRVAVEVAAMTRR